MPGIEVVRYGGFPPKGEKALSSIVAQRGSVSIEPMFLSKEGLRIFGKSWSSEASLEPVIDFRPFIFPTRFEVACLPDGPAELY
jgi:hypothetical protein